MNYRYFKIAVYSNIDDFLIYKTLEDIKGKRVLVPVGKRYVTGVGVEEVKKEDIDFDIEKIKLVKTILDKSPVINEELIKVGKWMCSYYLASPGSVFSTILSALYKIKTKREIVLVDNNNSENLTEKQREIIKYLENKKNKKASISEIEKILKIKNVYSILNILKEKNIIEIKEVKKTYGIKNKREKPESGKEYENEKFEYTEYQKNAIEKIKNSIEKNEFKTFLLFGVTGSGKTAVYVKIAEEVIKKSKKVIVLVPEIFLTSQIIERFKKYFKDKIAIYHSGLKPAERFYEWEKIKKGEVDIVIGTRSAIFAPFENIGAIIIDEEFDSSYKQENEPQYNAKDVAKYRAELNNAVLILGSATPSVESYYYAKINEYELINLPYRVNESQMPDIRIIDLRYNLNRLKNLFLSDELIMELKDALNNNEQVILFINRRGFSSFVHCFNCGYIEKCENCDIPLVYHKTENVLKCHYCNYTKEPIILCPICKKPLSYKGVGTQKIENIIKKFFPDKKIYRIDIDSMKNKRDYFKVYEMIKNKEVDILIGTQMIAKGFDFPELTFAGVVSIDTILNLPDFRAEERAFQLMVQVSGRTGRREKKGKVVIQTFHPDSISVKFLEKYEIEKFYEEELKIRKKLKYPPFSKLMQIIIKDKNKNVAENLAKKIKNTLIDLKNNLNFDMLGYAPAPLFKIQNNYRFSILIKCEKMNDLILIGKYIKNKFRNNKNVNIIIEPVDVL